MNKYTSRPTQDYMIREGRPGADREFFNRGGTNMRECNSGRAEGEYDGVGLLTSTVLLNSIFTVAHTNNRHFISIYELNLKQVLA